RHGAMLSGPPRRPPAGAHGGGHRQRAVGARRSDRPKYPVISLCWRPGGPGPRLAGPGGMARLIHPGLLAVALSACTGNILSPGAGDAGADTDQGPAGDPGRVTVHRLNNSESNNTVRDLLGTSLRPADNFPADDYTHGFDNIADALSMSPVQVGLYRRPALALAREPKRDPARRMPCEPDPAHPAPCRRPLGPRLGQPP